jgi:hypothetical protein
MPTTPTRWVPQAASQLVHVAALAFAASLVVKSESAMSLVLLLLEVEMQELPEDVALDLSRVVGSATRPSSLNISANVLGSTTYFEEIGWCKRELLGRIFRGQGLVIDGPGVYVRREVFG